ncbi:MAG TPA: type II CAAX endopeptidase family protein [Abditibacteriaceae bacterium]|jgi:hypothetical protein
MTPRLHPLLRLVICLFGIGALFVIITAVIVAALRTTTAISGQTVNLADFFTDNPLVATVLFYPPLLLWLWFCRRAIDGHSFRSLGLRLGSSGRGFMAGAACGALAITLLFGILWLTGNARINGPSPEAFESGAVVSAAVLCFFGVLFFAVGFMEELCFRGYAMHNLAAWAGLRFAIAAQAVVFALVHLGNVAAKVPNESGDAASAGATAAPSLLNILMDTRVAMLNIALIGVFFALSYVKTGSLWFPIGFHAAWNFFLGCIWSMPVSGVGTFRVLDVSVSSNALLTGGDFGAEGSILLTPLLLVLLWVVWQEADHPQALSDLAESRAAPEPHTALKPVPVAAEAAAPAEGQYVPSRFRTTMRPRTSAGVPLSLETGAATGGAASTAPFTRDVTASVAATANGAANLAPSAVPGSLHEAASATQPATSEAMSVYQVDVTASCGVAQSQNSTPEVALVSGAIVPAVTQTQRPDDVLQTESSASTEPLPADRGKVLPPEPEPAPAAHQPMSQTTLREASPPTPSPPTSPQGTSPPADSAPASSQVPTTPPAATPGTKKPRPRW